MNSTPIEHERKYLIRYPDVEALLNVPGTAVWKIIQTYLTASPGVTRRVRKVEEKGRRRYILTEKRRISADSALEDERELTRAEYASLLLTAQPGMLPVRKTRYRVPFDGWTAEIDVYPFWSDRAILEIETPEGTSAPLPPFVSLIRDVTDDFRYKNVALAASVPNDPV